MEKQRFMDLLSNFSSEKQYIQDGYYRIRSKADSIYEIAFLISDSCGASCVHPQMTVELKGDVVIPLQLFDLGTQPTRHLVRNEETKKKLDVELEALINKFEKVSQNLN